MADKSHGKKISGNIIIYLILSGFGVVILLLLFNSPKHPREKDYSGQTPGTATSSAPPGGVEAPAQTIVIGAVLTTSACIFSEQEASCEIKPDDEHGSGWVHRAANTDVNLRACWSPLAKAQHEDGTPVFKKIEYLDANGVPQVFDPENPRPASAFNFYVTRKINLSLNLAEKCRSAS